MRNLSLAAAVLVLSFLTAEVLARGGGGGGGAAAARVAVASRCAVGLIVVESRGGLQGRDNFERGPANDFRRDDEGFRGGPGRIGNTEKLGPSRLITPQTIRPTDVERRPGNQTRQLTTGRDVTARAFAGRPQKQTNPNQVNTDRNARYNQVNRQLAGERENLRDLYTHDFWRTHPHPHWIFRGPWDRWWQAPVWAALAAWGDWTWSEPAAYNYGDDIYYDGNTVYENGQPIGASEAYAQQAEALATNVPQADPNHVEWMPLGVFALSLDGEASGPEPTTLIQLAVSKEGIVAGSYLNMSSDRKQSLEGAVDIKSQRMAWTVVDEKWPVFETGIYNLTEKTAPVLIHFADGQTQQRLLVRVNQPAPADENAVSSVASE